MIDFAKRKCNQMKDGVIVKQFDSIPAASIELGIDKKRIYRSVKRGSVCSGYRFAYDEDLLDGEVWKDHECGRKVSNLGRVQNKRGCNTFGSNRKAGYMFVYDGSKMRLVHRMVMETFEPHENSNTLMVDHINGVKSDNRFENLRWVTAKENAANRKPRQRFRHCQSCNCF